MVIMIKKAKGTKKCVIKRIPKFYDYKNCLFNNKPILKSQQRFKSETYNVFTERVNKIALNSNDDERMETFDRITSYPYDTNAGKVCKTEFWNTILNKISSTNFDDNTNENKTKITQKVYIFYIIHIEY